MALERAFGGAQSPRLIEAIRELLPRDRLEGVVAAFLTASGPVCRLMAVGEPGAVEIRARQIVRSSLDYNATALVLAHNHPSQDSRPSRLDIESTARLKGLLETIDVELIDHLIFVADRYRSMKTGRIALL